MTILVTGKQGQLARSLASANRKDLVCVGRPDLDFTMPGSLAAVLDAAKPDAVINAAAYTFVDKAESDAAAAFAINRDGPAELARLCAARGIVLIHVSTDCVFDGEKAGPYEPDDSPAPVPYTHLTPPTHREGVISVDVRALKTQQQSNTIRDR